MQRGNRMSETEELTVSHLLKSVSSLKAENERLKRSIKPIGRLVVNSENQISLLVSESAQLSGGSVDIYVKSDI